MSILSATGWGGIIVPRLGVVVVVGTAVHVHDLVQPPLQGLVGVAVLPAVAFLHYLAGTASCPVCGKMFASTGESKKDFFFLLFRAYFSIRCGHCRSRIGAAIPKDET